MRDGTSSTSWESYFEQSNHWTQKLSPFARSLLRKAMRVVPREVTSLLDVGCGAGDLCRLAGERGVRAVGLDRSAAALAAAHEIPRLRGDVAQLPFPEASFDLVVAQDVLEHLPDDLYARALSEIVRVARRWVLILSPHAEDLRYAQHRCRVCGAEFHENGHRRSITLEGLCRDLADRAYPDTVFYGEENWPYFDSLSAEARIKLAGRRPSWELALCPACGAPEHGPAPGGAESVLGALEVGLNQEFQAHPAHWRRNRLSEFGVLFRKDGDLVRQGSQPGRCDPFSMLSGPRQLAVTVGEESASESAELPVSLMAWPRGLISCASDLQSLPRPIHHSALSYLYTEGQQWGEVTPIEGRWARLFRPDLPGGHACFVISGSDLFDKGIGVEFFDELPARVRLEIYDFGSQQYLGVGVFECTGSKEWRHGQFPVPRALPSAWGYLCHLVSEHPSGRVPIFRIGVGAPQVLGHSSMQLSGDRWCLEKVDYPEGLFRDGDLSALISVRDVKAAGIALESESGPALFQLADTEWRAETPLFLAAGVYDALPDEAPDDEQDVAGRARLLAIHGMADRSAALTRASTESLKRSLETLTDLQRESESRWRQAEAELHSVRAQLAEANGAIERYRDELDQARVEIGSAQAELGQAGAELEETKHQLRIRRGIKGGAKEILRSLRRRIAGPPLLVQPPSPVSPWRPFVRADERGQGLRVLILSHMFPHPDQPTSGSFIFEQVRALRERGLDARVLVGRPFWMRHVNPKRLWQSHRAYERHHDLSPWLSLEGVPVRYLPYRIVAPFFSHGWMYRSSKLRAIADVHTDFPFEIVHAHTAYLDGGAGLAVARRFAVPLIITEHTGPFSRLTAGYLVRRWTVRALNGADRILAVSEALKGQITSHMAASRVARVTVMPNGVDVEMFRPPQQWRFDANAPRVLFVGYFVPIKNLPLLLEAFSLVRREIPRATMSLVGEGETEGQEEELSALINSMGLAESVSLRGYQPRQEVARIMREDCDLVVLSSDAETFGCVLVEALASGKPVVSTRCGGPEDIVSAPELGELCPPGDARALADAILKVARNLDRYDPEAIRADAAARFSYQAIADRLERVYREAMAKVRR
jgi:glycosyltransferase involved in cell wall biosynthesis/SAM-dependent methyltransferase